MATSRFEELRAALLTAINTQLTTDAVSGVTVHKYARVVNERVDNLWLGDISGSQEPFTQGSGGFRAEEMEIEVAISCPTFGDTPAEFATVEQRAELIMASVEKAVRNDITAGGTVYNVEFAAYETNHQFDDSGALGVVEITLTAEAHI